MDCLDAANDDIWVALYGQGDDCDNQNGCTCALKDGGGTCFVGGSWVSGGLDIKNDKDCTMMDSGHMLKGEDCTSDKRRVCKVDQCSATTTTTSTAGKQN